MHDLIERLIDAIRKHKTLYEADHGWDKTTLDALDTVIKALEQPTIEPQRKNGEWIPHPDDTFDKWFCCSVCHKGLTMFDGTYNFCPNCGAKMEERRTNGTEQS